ncbi:MAG: hypothetical protein AB7P69_20195, partial [Candidatus Binatia bacterium]
VLPNKNYPALWRFSLLAATSKEIKLLTTAPPLSRSFGARQKEFPGVFDLGAGAPCWTGAPNHGLGTDSRRTTVLRSFPHFTTPPPSLEVYSTGTGKW